MRILVLGGTGFIGSHVVAILARAGHDVTVYHRGVTEPALPSGVQHVHHPDACIPMLRFPREIASNWDAVIHFVLLSEAEARAALEFFGGHARRLVAISSADVYAAYGRLLGTEPAETVIPDAQGETAPLRTALYPYGRKAQGPWGELIDYDKVLVERAVASNPALATTILRLPMVYGPGDPQHRFARWIHPMLESAPQIVVGETEARWRATHGYVENVAAAVALAAADERAANQVFNVGEATTPTILERIRALADCAGWRGEVRVLRDSEVPPQLRPPYPLHTDLVLNTSRIRRELGFHEPISDHEALRRTLTSESQVTPSSAS